MSNILNDSINFAKDKVKNDTEAYQRKEFCNNLRKKLTKEWSQTGNQYVDVKYWQGYAQDLETEIFNLLNSDGRL